MRLLKEIIVISFFSVLLVQRAVAQQSLWTRLASNTASCLAVSQNDSLLFAGLDRGLVIAIDRRTKNVDWTCRFGEAVYSLEVSPDGNTLLASGILSDGSSAVALLGTDGQFQKVLWSAIHQGEGVSKAIFYATDTVIVTTSLGYYLVQVSTATTVRQVNIVGKVLVSSDLQQCFLFCTPNFYDPGTQQWYVTLMNVRDSTSVKVPLSNDYWEPGEGIILPGTDRILENGEVISATTGLIDTVLDDVASNPVLLSNDSFAYVVYDPPKSSTTNTLVIRETKTLGLLQRISPIVSSTEETGVIYVGPMIGTNDGSAIYASGVLLVRLALDSTEQHTNYTSALKLNGYSPWEGRLAWYPSILLDTLISGGAPILFGQTPDREAGVAEMIDIATGDILPSVPNNWYYAGGRLTDGHDSLHQGGFLDIETGQLIITPPWAYNGFLASDDSTFVSGFPIDSTVFFDTIADTGRYVTLADVFLAGYAGSSVPLVNDTLKDNFYFEVGFAGRTSRFLIFRNNFLITIDPLTFKSLDSIAFLWPFDHYLSDYGDLFSIDKDQSTLSVVSTLAIGNGAVQSYSIKLPSKIQGSLLADSSLILVPTTTGWFALNAKNLSIIDSQSVDDFLGFAMTPDRSRVLCFSQDGLLRCSTTSILPLSVTSASTTDTPLITIFPNPLRGHGTLSFALVSASSLQLQIFNLQGSELSAFLLGRFDSGNHEVSLQLGGLPSGTYYLRLVAYGDSTEDFFVCPFTVK